MLKFGVDFVHEKNCIAGQHLRLMRHFNDGRGQGAGMPSILEQAMNK